MSRNLPGARVFWFPFCSVGIFGLQNKTRMGCNPVACGVTGILDVNSRGLVVWFMG